MKIKYELAQLFEADPTWSVSKILRYADEKGQLDQRSMIKVIALLVAKMEVVEGEMTTISSLNKEWADKVKDLESANKQRVDKLEETLISRVETFEAQVATLSHLSKTLSDKYLASLKKTKPKKK